MRTAVGMSGGVDSSVVAKMLVDEGHEVVGLFLKLWADPLCSVNKDNRCCNYEALEDARKVANQLGIPFYVINAEKAFKEAVVDNFLDEYQSLRTPNPCIVCNDKIKFDLLLKKALDIGCEKLATGHYARIKYCHSDRSASKQRVEESLYNSELEKGSLCSQSLNRDDKTDGDYRLLTGLDETKDQSYMLYRLNQNQLSKILFPLGEMTKKEVRKLALDWDLPVKEKAESQEICFINDDYRSFLKRYLPKTFVPGDIVDQNGKIVGKHEGLINYTIGQRKGIEQVKESKVQSPKSKENEDRKPLYVVGFDKAKNQLIVGEDEETYQSEMSVSNIHWISPNTLYQLPNTCSVKIRYRHPAVDCRVQNNHYVIPAEAGIQRSMDPQPSEGGSTSGRRFGLRPPDKSGRGDDTVKVLFQNPQRAISPGQSAVFYLDDQVLGGGIIIG